MKGGIVWAACLLLILDGEFQVVAHPTRSIHPHVMKLMRHHMKDLEFEKSPGDEFVLENPQGASSLGSLAPFLDAGYDAGREADPFAITKYSFHPIQFTDKSTENPIVFSSTRSSIFPAISSGTYGASSPNSGEVSASSRDPAASNENIDSSIGPSSDTSSSGSNSVGASSGSVSGIVSAATGAYLGYHLWQRHRLFEQLQDTRYGFSPEALRGKTNEELLSMLRENKDMPCDGQGVTNENVVGEASKSDQTLGDTMLGIRAKLGLADMPTSAKELAKRCGLSARYDRMEADARGSGDWHVFWTSAVMQMVQAYRFPEDEDSHELRLKVQQALLGKHNSESNGDSEEEPFEEPLLDAAVRELGLHKSMSFYATDMSFDELARIWLYFYLWKDLKFKDNKFRPLLHGTCLNVDMKIDRMLRDSDLDGIYEFCRGKEVTDRSTLSRLEHHLSKVEKSECSTSRQDMMYHLNRHCPPTAIGAGGVTCDPIGPCKTFDHSDKYHPTRNVAKDHAMLAEDQHLTEHDRVKDQYARLLTKIATEAKAICPDYKAKR